MKVNVAIANRSNKTVKRVRVQGKGLSRKRGGVCVM